MFHLLGRPLSAKTVAIGYIMLYAIWFIGPLMLTYVDGVLVADTPVHWTVDLHFTVYFVSLAHLCIALQIRRTSGLMGGISMLGKVLPLVYLWIIVLVMRVILFGSPSLVTIWPLI